MTDLGNGRESQPGDPVPPRGKLKQWFYLPTAIWAVVYTVWTVYLLYVAYTVVYAGS